MFSATGEETLHKGSISRKIFQKKQPAAMKQLIGVRGRARKKGTQDWPGNQGEKKKWKQSKFLGGASRPPKGQRRSRKKGGRFAVGVSRRACYCLHDGGRENGLPNASRTSARSLNHHRGRPLKLAINAREKEGGTILEREGQKAKQISTQNAPGCPSNQRK